MNNINKDSLKKIKICEVCDNSELLNVLNLGMHPLCDDLILKGNKEICKEYPIEILLCQNCNTAHQKYQVNKEKLFPTSYHYRARFTADVINGMRDLVNKTLNFFDNLDDKTVLDIGCNDGTLLNIFSEKGFKVVGIEPTDAYEDALKIHDNIYNEFLTEEIAEEIVSNHGKPDLITFTNVFAHIDDLNKVLSSLKVLMGKNTHLVIENHYLGAILKHNQFDTFYHEHPRSYSYTSFTFIAEKLGLYINSCEFPSRYGGNIRVFMSKKNKKINRNVSVKENSIKNDFSIMNKNIEIWKIKKLNEIDNLVKKYGKLKSKAFPGRAAILIKLLGLDEEKIEFNYEKPGSMKIGHYIPGTKIEIISDNELFLQKKNDLPIINFAWHIANEIKYYLRENDFNNKIINIIENRDFIK